MYNLIRCPDHTYAIEVLNDFNEWVLDMYDVPIDIYSVKKLAEHYQSLGYSINNVRIVKVY